MRIPRQTYFLREREYSLEQGLHRWQRHDLWREPSCGQPGRRIAPTLVSLVYEGGQSIQMPPQGSQNPRISLNWLPVVDYDQLIGH